MSKADKRAAKKKRAEKLEASEQQFATTMLWCGEGVAAPEASRELVSAQDAARELEAVAARAAKEAAAADEAAREREALAAREREAAAARELEAAAARELVAAQEAADKAVTEGGLRLAKCEGEVLEP